MDGRVTERIRSVPWDDSRRPNRDRPRDANSAAYDLQITRRSNVSISINQAPSRIEFTVGHCLVHCLFIGVEMGAQLCLGHDLHNLDEVACSTT